MRAVGLRPHFYLAVRGGHLAAAKLLIEKTAFDPSIAYSSARPIALREGRIRGCDPVRAGFGDLLRHPEMEWHTPGGKSSRMSTPKEAQHHCGSALLMLRGL